jgi:hypothetical protein
MQCQANYPHLKVLNDSHEVGYRHTFKSLFPASHQIKLEVNIGWLTDYRDYATVSKCTVITLQWSAAHVPVQVIFAGFTFLPWKCI